VTMGYCGAHEAIGSQPGAAEWARRGCCEEIHEEVACDRVEFVSARLSC